MSEPTLEPKFKAFKDGVYDAIIYGRMDEESRGHYYKCGYDFGLIIHSDLGDGVE